MPGKFHLSEYFSGEVVKLLHVEKIGAKRVSTSDLGCNQTMGTRDGNVHLGQHSAYSAEAIHGY